MSPIPLECFARQELDDFAIGSHFSLKMNQFVLRSSKNKNTFNLISSEAVKNLLLDHL